MIESQLPCALFVSDFTDPNALISQILRGPIFSDVNVAEDDIKGFLWKIDTKYYETTINLCPLKSDIVPPASLLDLAEALVLYFDSENKNSFDNLKLWTDNIKNDLPETLLLVCDTLKTTAPNSVSQNAVSSWCLQNGFELIVLDDLEIESNGDYDIIPEKKGVDRIIEALHTHTWSNLQMKSVPNPNKPQTNGFSGVDNHDDDNDFCELFSQLHSMKESISSLPLRDRRACAEQVVSTFWKAIGGDDDEIEDPQL